jgi:Dockerin type I domain
VWSFTTAVKADLDRDGDVDQEDFGLFQACLSGSGVAVAAGCADADLDGDGDVDQADLDAFRACFRGANIRPGC